MVRERRGGYAHPRPDDHLRHRLPSVCPESAAQPGNTAQRPARVTAAIRAALAAARAPGHEPHDDDDGHRDQPDDEKRLERGHDPARNRDSKPYGEDRAQDCPDDPAHVPSMPQGLADGEPGAIIALPFPQPYCAAPSFTAQSPPGRAGRNQLRLGFSRPTELPATDLTTSS
jgi:hypothetical protein